MISLVLIIEIILSVFLEISFYHLEKSVARILVLWGPNMMFGAVKINILQLGQALVCCCPQPKY